MKTCPRCRVARPDDAFKARNGRTVSNCSPCRDVANVTRTRRRRELVTNQVAEPTPKRRRIDPSSSSDRESRFRNPTPQSSGEQRAQRHAAASSRLQRYQRLQAQRELLPNPDGAPPQVDDNVKEPVEQDVTNTDDSLNIFDIPVLHEQLHPQHNPLPHDHPIELTAPAMSDADWTRLQDWMRVLDQEQQFYCDRCKELWFDINLKHGICERCVTRDRDQGDGPPLMSRENKMDPGAMPNSLPKLTDIEQMLIAPVHISMYMAHVKGAQYRYKGHVMTFLRDIPDVVTVLPRLPQHCHIVIIRPKQVLVDGRTIDDGTTRQFRKSFTVRRWAVQQWLNFLCQNHPGFSDIRIDPNRLAQLPENDHVLEQIQTVESDEPGPPPAQGPGGNLPEDPDMETYDTGTVPQTRPLRTEAESFRLGIDPRAREQMPALDWPRLQTLRYSQQGRGQRIFSLAFPTLFPRGEADWALPRDRSKGLKFYDWVQHLMRYCDSRFAQHDRFRYAVFNTWIRDLSSARSRWVVNKHKGQPVSLDDIIANLDADQQLLNSAVRCAASIKGTRPYWKRRGTELSAHIQWLYIPAFFFTFSAADTQWDSLQRHMPDYWKWKDADDEERINRQNLRSCPHIAAWHFHFRFRTFLKYVFKPKFGITDYWFRYEFQGRGSTHVHGFAWLDPSAAPKVQSAPLNEASRQEFTSFWSKHVFAVNPEPDRQPPARRSRGVYNASTVQLVNTIEQLSDVVNRTQKHACSESYCLRKRKRVEVDAPVDLPRQCRFYFPREIGPARTNKSRNPNFYTFCAASNDTMLNQCNPTVALGWRANTDLTPCTDLGAVVGYITKYCAKDETPSTPYTDIARSLIPFVNEVHPQLSFATKIINRLIGERDWSAQEVSHLLFGIPLFSSSRQVITFDCRPEDDIGTIVDLDDDGIKPGKTILQKYKERRNEYTHTSLLTFLSTFEHGSRKVHKPRPQSKDRVIVYQPHYKPQTNHPDYPDFCRTKIAIHHPWREYPCLPWNSCETWSAAYEYCKSHCEPHSPDHLEPLDVEAPTEEFDHEDPPNEDEHDPMALLAGETAYRNPAARHEDPDNLGERTDDWRYYWQAHVNTYRDVGQPDMPDIHAGINWWQRARELSPGPVQVSWPSQHTVDSLAAEQRLIYDKFMTHFRYGGRQLLLNVDGRAGTGKSFIIQVLSAYLSALSGSEDTVLRCAPTGAASFGISGSTMHSLLKLPINKPLKPLKPAQAQSIQSRLARTKYLIIDEKSMISLKTLAHVDFRLQEAFANDQRFGGLSILLLGDFWQLPPVNAKVMYHSVVPVVAQARPLPISSQSHAPHLETGIQAPAPLPHHLPFDEDRAVQLYRAFDQSIELTVQQRQDPSQVDFASALEGLRNSTVARANWETLTNRCQVNLPHAEISEFDDAIRLYSTNLAATALNHQCQRLSRQPVFKVIAENSDTTAEKASVAEAGMLEPYLELSIGCKLMVLENIWTERGIVNGTQCRLYDIVWPEDADPTKEAPDQPLCLLVGVLKTSCTGPFVEDYVWRGRDFAVVPIYRSQRDFWLDGANRYRSQFPVRLAYAITIHKAQGMTVPKVVLNITHGRKDMGLFYVAASRVRRLEDLMFEDSFDYERVNGGETELAAMRRIDWDRRHLQRFITMNQATSSESRRQGPSQLSQAVLQAMPNSAFNNASQNA